MIASSRLGLMRCAEHAQADHAAETAGVPRDALMAAAARSVVDTVTKRWSTRPCAVLCGPGDNGGDGYAAASILRGRGWPVRVAAPPGPSNASPAAENMRTAWGEPVDTLSTEALAGAELLIDALFGAGLSRALSGVAAECARAAAAPIVAVDIPSGVGGDTGRVDGPAFRAEVTVTFLRKKPGHVLEPGRSLCGEVILTDIGHPADATPNVLSAFENTPRIWRRALVWPAAETHKHARGALGVVSGPLTQTGAARLAARAGLRAGAGLTTLYGPPSAMIVLAAASTAVMTEAFRDAEELAVKTRAARAVTIGPAVGVGEATRENVLALLGGDAPVVLDADALTSFEAEPERLIAHLRAFDVLTPHIGEFRRLFRDIDLERSDPLTACRQAAALANCVVLLKGACTVVANPDGAAVVNTHASPFLATAGSGDVLAGIIGGLVAQGVDSFSAACAGAWIHGETSLRLGAGLIAEDLCEAIPGVLQSLNAARSPRG